LFFSQEVLTGVSLFRDSLRRVVVPEETFPFSEEEVKGGVSRLASNLLKKYLTILKKIG